MKQVPFIKIEDYREVRAILREFMRDTKKKKPIMEQYARLRFLKEIKLEVDSFLKLKGMLRRR